MTPSGKWVGISEPPQELFQITHTLPILPREEKREKSFKNQFSTPLLLSERGYPLEGLCCGEKRLRIVFLKVVDSGQPQ